MKKKISIEDIFLSALKSNAKLKWFLQYDINLIDYLDAAWSQYMAFVDITFAFIPKSKRREMIGDINVPRILGILERERPDLHKTLNTEKGITWLERQIKNFKERFL